MPPSRGSSLVCWCWGQRPCWRAPSKSESNPGGPHMSDSDVPDYFQLGLHIDTHDLRCGCCSLRLCNCRLVFAETLAAPPSDRDQSSAGLFFSRRIWSWGPDCPSSASSIPHPLDTEPASQHVRSWLCDIRLCSRLWFALWVMCTCNNLYSPILSRSHIDTGCTFRADIFASDPELSAALCQHRTRSAQKSNFSDMVLWHHVCWPQKRRPVWSWDLARAAGAHLFSEFGYHWFHSKSLSGPNPAPFYELQAMPAPRPRSATSPPWHPQHIYDF